MTSSKTIIVMMAYCKSICYGDFLKRTKDMIEKKQTKTIKMFSFILNLLGFNIILIRYNGKIALIYNKIKINFTKQLKYRSYLHKKLTKFDFE
jgi:hypothetical protein